MKCRRMISLETYVNIETKPAKRYAHKKTRIVRNPNMIPIQS